MTWWGRVMRIAVTGGTGFIGSHLSRRLVADGHEVVLIVRDPKRLGLAETIPQATVAASDLAQVEQLTEALAGCHVVAHCAGINRELRQQTYARVHVAATRN